MIKLPTTLILGAGASVPYGYPTGEVLRSSIIELATAIGVRPKAGTTSVNGKYVNTDLVSSARELFGDKATFPDKELYDNKELHKEFVTAFSGDKSSSTIDRFLYDHSDFAEIGRYYAVLALLICQYHAQVAQKSLPYPRIVDASNESKNDDWYASLVGRLRPGCDSKDALESNNNLQILTFNYDRSLDLYLEHHLANTQRHKGADWTKVVQIEHLYGELPAAPMDTNSINLKGLPLHAWNNRSKIRLIGERTEAGRSKLHSHMINAKRIVFIGFGFDEDNIELLGLPDVLKEQTINCHNYLPFGSDYTTGTNRRTRNLFQKWGVELDSERRELRPLEKHTQHRQLGLPKNRHLTILPFESEDFYESEITNDILAGLLGFS